MAINYEAATNPPIGYRVAHIEVTRGGVFEKRFAFGYGAHEGSEGLLKLTEVRQEFPNGVAGPPHRFDYWSGSVRARQSIHRDFLGYPTNYRGSINHLIGNYQADGHTIGSSRAPSLTYTLAGVLSRIHYPTGGSTGFEYELNRAQVAGQSAPESDCKDTIQLN